MKRVWFASLVLMALVTMLGARAWATPIPPGGIVAPGMADASGPILADTGLIPIAFDGVDGTVREVVVADFLNPFGAGDLSFLVQVSVTAGSVDDVALGSVDSLALDVSQFTPPPPFFVAGFVIAPLAERFTPGLIDFDLLGGVGATQSSLALITRTNTKTPFVPGIIDVSNASGSITVPGFAPAAVPEPSTWLLLGIGLLGLFRYGRYQKKQSA